MKNRSLILLLLLILIALPVHTDANDNPLTETISKTEIKIGEKITLTVTIPDLKDAQVLWEEMNVTGGAAEIISKKDSYKKETLTIEIVFTILESGTFNDFSITLPINRTDGEILYLKTEKYTIKVAQALTPEELENLKKIDDPSKVELKPEKTQEKMKFKFSFIIITILIICGLILIAMFIYFILYKLIMKKGKDLKTINQLPPYEKFLVDIETINFDIQDTRETTERKLSDLTEILKELIYGDFSLNAPSETTKELIISMQELMFPREIIQEIRVLFTEIDMIKFAKAPVNFDKFDYYINIIKKSGDNIHKFKLKQEQEAQKNENIQT